MRDTLLGGNQGKVITAAQLIIDTLSSPNIRAPYESQ